MSANLLLFQGKSTHQNTPVSLINKGDSWGIVGDSMSLGSRRPKMYAFWLALEMSGRCRWLPTTNIETPLCQGSNMAINGNDTSDIAARAGTIGGAGLDVCFCMSFENDGAAVTAETIIANWQTTLGALSGAKRVYLIGSGVTRSVYSSSSVTERNNEVNAWMASAQETFPNVRYIPSSEAWTGITIHDGLGGAGEDSIDGTHLNLQGAKKLAANLWRFIKDEFEDGNAYLASPYMNNVFPCDFTGMGGSLSSATGEVADGLTLTNTTGAMLVASKGTLDGKPSQILTLSGTASSTDRIRLREACANNFAVGDSIDGWGRIKVSAADGSSPPVGMKSFGFEGGGGRHTFMSQYHNNITEGEWSTPFDGIFRVQPDIFPSGSSFFYTDLNIQPVTGASLDIRIEIADVQLFNMTQEGV